MSESSPSSGDPEMTTELNEALRDFEKEVRNVARAQNSGLPYPVQAGNLVAARSHIFSLFKRRETTALAGETPLNEIYRAMCVSSPPLPPESVSAWCSHCETTTGPAEIVDHGPGRCPNARTERNRPMGQAKDNRPRLGPLDGQTEYDIDRYAVAYSSRLELRARVDTAENRAFADRAASEEYATLETLRARIRELISEGPDASR